MAEVIVSKGADADIERLVIFLSEAEPAAALAAYDLVLGALEVLRRGAGRLLALHHPDAVPTGSLNSETAGGSALQIGRQSRAGLDFTAFDLFDARTIASGATNSSSMTGNNAA